MATTTRRVPALVSSTLLALGVALTVLGVVLLEARHSLLTPEGLSSARRRRAGRSARVGVRGRSKATDAVLAAQPDLTAFRPVVASVAKATVSSYPFQRAIQASIRSAVAAVLSEGSSKIALSIPGSGRPASQRAGAGKPGPGREDPASGARGDRRRSR